MRTRGRVYQEPRLSETEREYIEHCPRGCGSFLSEELQRGANNSAASVLFCLSTNCGWREWALSDICGEIELLARQGHRPAEISERLGVSERTVFRRLSMSINAPASL